MRNLILFLNRFRTFGLFLLIEAVCIWLIVGYNQRPNASFFNSSNALAASISDFSSSTSDYLNLGLVNQQLLEENKKLREQLTLLNLHRPNEFVVDSAFTLVEGKVINGTFTRATNYLTLDIGQNAGVKPGMGVLSKNGVAGRVKSVSGNFATVISLLHRNMLISSAIKSTNTLCTTQWNGESPLYSEVRYVPRHIALQIGDSVVTSGYNAIFPPGQLIGVISDLSLKKEEAFYEVKIRLATDFTSLNYLYVIRNTLKSERDSLELAIVIP